MILITEDAMIVASLKEIYCIALNAEFLLKYLLPQVTQSLEVLLDGPKSLQTFEYSTEKKKNLV